jgi:LmbE family N-acetylglucosaminyl deacetylase
VNKKILTIAAHPDDEILGCGATMAKLAEAGNEVHILIMAEGLTSRQVKRDRESKNTELSELALSAERASKAIGALSIELSDFPDNRMDGVELLDIIKKVESKIELIQPDILFTHFPGDLNIDHRITAEAVITAARPLPDQKIKEIYFFEVPSSTDYQIYSDRLSFQPNVYYQISQSQMDQKLKALECYHTEMREFPHVRSIDAVRALSIYRGASIGYLFAEAFMLGRMIR